MSKQGKVHPIIRDNHEMKTRNHTGRPRSVSGNSWTTARDGISVLSKWKHFRNCLRDRENTSGKLRPSIRDGPGPKDESKKKSQSVKVTQCALDSDVEDLGNDRVALYDTLGYMKPLPVVHHGSQVQPAIASSRALIIYFAKLARADLDGEQELDFDFVDELLQDGADINFTDRHGQTVMHEVARIWHTDVAKYVLENGGDINKADSYGRTPLHVAAAVDYAEMVEFLVENKANLHARTAGEMQTPIHYAAKNDASMALKVLLKLGGSMEDRDFKKRTPLQVAAELDRSETAKFLIAQGSPAGVYDNNGIAAMTLMISKMPPVAKEALDQFHTTDRANRKQFFYLNYLEPYPGEFGCSTCARSPLHVVVLFKQMELIMHPVFQRLLEVKWDLFGRRGMILQVIVQLMFVLIWTALGVTLHIGENNNYYYPPRDYWWRIVLESFACSMTVYFLLLELLEIRASNRSHQKWQKWQIREMEKDLNFSHPRWPEERKYLEMEVRNIGDSGISYFNDAWNYFDWITYGWVLGIIVTRIMSVGWGSGTAKSLHPKVFALGLIFVWLRLMKVFRAFVSLGPFIVMIGHIIDDTLKFAFLYFEFFIPYVCAFWIIFGGVNNAKTVEEKGQSSDGIKEFNDMIYSVWQMTYVGNFPWDSFLVIDRVMAQILCGTYLAVSSIVLLNLFIALMSDTFQRVYDNAKANSAMQRASYILSLEEGMGERRREKHRKQIHTNMGPEELYYDDDSTQPNAGDLERMTHQIKDVVDEIQEHMHFGRNGKDGDKSFAREIEKLRNDLVEVSSQHQNSMKEVHDEIAEMKSLLLQLLRQPAPTEAQVTLPSVRALQALPLEHPPSEERSEKKSPSSRSTRKRHRHEPSLKGEDKIPYQGLPLVQDTSADSALPSVSALSARVLPRPRTDPPA